MAVTLGHAPPPQRVSPQATAQPSNAARPSLRRAANSILDAAIRLLDAQVPPATREEWRANAEAFARARPKLTAFLLLHLLFSGIPIAIFTLGFAGTAAAAALTAASAALAAVGTLAGAAAALLLVPTLCFTSLAASTVFVSGLVGVTVLKAVLAVLGPAAAEANRGEANARPGAVAGVMLGGPAVAVAATDAADRKAHAEAERALADLRNADSSNDETHSAQPRRNDKLSSVGRGSDWVHQYIHPAADSSGAHADHRVSPLLDASDPEPLPLTELDYTHGTAAKTSSHARQLPRDPAPNTPDPRPDPLAALVSGAGPGAGADADQPACCGPASAHGRAEPAPRLFGLGSDVSASGTAERLGGQRLVSADAA